VSKPSNGFRAGLPVARGGEFLAHGLQRRPCSRGLLGELLLGLGEPVDGEHRRFEVVPDAHRAVANAVLLRRGPSRLGFEMGLGAAA
jgi:hypothetical protein